MGKEDIGITVSKKDDFSEWYTQLVIKAELADYAPVKGLIVLRPDGYSIWESLKRSLDEKFSRRGVRNGFLPVLIPESLLSKEKEHFAGFNPEVFWVTHSGDGEMGERLALRPTSETLAYSLYAKWIKSWRDLPLRINFWNTALRAEIKGTKPFLRTSEFLWQEGHTVHADEVEARAETEEILKVYQKTVEEELAIPVITGKKSESEKFVGAVYTSTMESMMPDGKALQMGTSHFLGQNFSRPFGIKFVDKKNIEHHSWQTSWGVSWRLIGAMIMVHGDDSGLVLPPKVAPVQVVIIPIYYSMDDKKAVMSEAGRIKEQLLESGIRTHMDSRQELTPGFKFHDWELRGVPIRIEIGPRDIQDKKTVIATRFNREKSSHSFDGLDSHISGLLDSIQKKMLAAAKKILDANTKDAEQYPDFVNELKKGGFVRAGWCGDSGCEEKIKGDTGADIRVIPSGAGSGTCIVCKKPSESAPLFARGY